MVELLPLRAERDGAEVRCVRIGDVMLRLSLWYSSCHRFDSGNLSEDDDISCVDRAWFA